MYVCLPVSSSRNTQLHVAMPTVTTNNMKAITTQHGGHQAGDCIHDNSASRWPRHWTAARDGEAAAHCIHTPPPAAAHTLLLTSLHSAGRHHHHRYHRHHHAASVVLRIIIMSVCHRHFSRVRHFLTHLSVFTGVDCCCKHLGLAVTMLCL